MHATHNERGTVLIFVTLSIVLLLIMVGMGLDTGHLVFVRAQGQAAVDAPPFRWRRRFRQEAPLK